MAESREHLQLKEAAMCWALGEGYQVVSAEVRVPNSNFRADAVACQMHRPEKGEFAIQRTALFECKQARPDFLNDSLPEKKTHRRLKSLRKRREKLEELIGVHYPHLRQGDSLFPEYQRVDVSEINHKGYQKVVREIATLEKGVFGRTKFDRMVRYRCADLCYLVIKKGIMDAAEAPSAWGILEWESEENSPLILVRKPKWNECAPAHRLELLYRIARQRQARFSSKRESNVD